MIGLSAMLWAATLAAAATPTVPAGQDAAEVEQADQAFNRALERFDVNALRELIDDHYVFTDPTGRVSTKQDVIEGFETGRIKILSQRTQDVHVQVYGDAAVETGMLTSVAVRDGKNSGGHSALLACG